MAAGKLSREERLRKKREAERKRYQKIKSNPVAYEEHMMKAAEKYVKRKQKGQVKLVGEMTRREHSAKKKQWRTNSRAYLARKKIHGRETAYLSENSPPMSVSDEVCVPSSKALSGRKRVRRDRSKVVRNNEKLKEENQKLKRELYKLKKRMYRTKTGNSSVEESPNTKVDKLMKRGNTAVWRQLLLHEVFTSQVLDGYKKTKKLKTKIALKAIILRNHQYLRKYKLMNECRELNDALFRKSSQRSLPLSNQNTWLSVRKISDQVRLDVRKFFEQDDVSRICPGKKETVTRKKIKKQKRYISDSLINLHKRFLKSYPCKISYSAFCALRPFWVLIPKVTDRETCMCIHHENFSLIVTSLHHAKVIPCNNTTAVLSALCCDSTNVKCLHRKCESCCRRPIPYKDYEESGKIEYFQWVTKNETYRDKNNVEKIAKKIKKERFEMTLGELVVLFEKKLKSFFIHEGNARHQYYEISCLKKKARKARSADLH